MHLAVSDLKFQIEFKHIRSRPLFDLICCGLVFEVDLTEPPSGEFGPVDSVKVYSVFACMPDIYN